MAVLTSPGNLARNSLPASGAFVITPDDNNDLTAPIRYLTVSVAGTVSFLDWTRGANVTASLPAGTYSMEALRINATGTSATGLTGWK